MPTVQQKPIAYLILASSVALSGCASKMADQDMAGESIVTTGKRADKSGDVLPPPPPPPPPPPAMSSVMVTAQRAGAPVAEASSYYVPPVVVPSQTDRENYDGEEISPVKVVATEPVSTFSVDVDTGAYANVRRFLNQGQLPPESAVRTEELINYFRYDYPRPDSTESPFSITTDVTTTPWNDDTRLLRVGIRGYDIAREDRPAANIVFLLDVSGSMNRPDKLPLLKSALTTLTNQLSDKDRVSIVVYAGAAGLVLEPTNDKRKIREALDALQAGGSTAGGAGIQLAYQIARDNFIDGGVNRVMLATDGDFNVGVTDHEKLIDLIESNRDSGITLTTLGFGQGNYNEALMEQAADHGNGNYAYIDSATEAQKVLSDEMSSTLFTIAKDVKVQIEFNPAQISQYRLIGYENRLLREEDFNNDKVDAGDIGAGHQVTALYEVVPADAKGWVEPRRYQSVEPTSAKRPASEMAFIKFRYKLPDEDSSKLIDRPLLSSMLANARAPQGDAAFAISVAAFGQLLRGDTMMGDFELSDVRQLAGNSGNFWRQEFSKLVQIAEALQPVEQASVQ